MTKLSMLWLGTLGLLVVGSAIDRYRTRREVEDLRHKYGAVVAVNAETAHRRNGAHEQPTVLARVSNAVQVTEPAIAEPASARRPVGSDAQAKSGLDEPSSIDQAAHIDAVFSEETEDRSWSREAESKITSALLPLAVGGARVQAVACHSTLCKVRVEHTTDEGIRDFVERIFTTQGYWAGPMMIAGDSAGPQGSFAKVIYYSKAGHDIPYLD